MRGSCSLAKTPTNTRSRACNTRIGGRRRGGDLAAAPRQVPVQRPVQAAAAPSSQSSVSISASTTVSGLGRRPLPRIVLEPCQSVSGRPQQGVFLFGGLFGGGGNNNDDDEYEDEEYTVFKLQVGLFGDISKWQKRLDNIGTKYDTDDEEGLHNIFRDALVLILRNTEYAGYVASAGKVFGDLGAAERKFNSVLMEERLKFKEETLVNVDGKKKSRKLDDEYKGGDKDGLDRWLCMTLLLCAEGKVKIPNISSVYDLKQVLTTLGGLSADDLVAVELLWTPQEDLDYYTKDELLSDYPSLLPLS